MKKLRLFLVVCAACGWHMTAKAATKISNAEQITEEWLIEAGKESGYTEHVAHFKALFSCTKVRTFLEFGLGFSTKYFIDNSEKVISVEFITPGSGPDWIKYCLSLYRNCDNWKPIAYFSGKGLDTSWAPYKYMGLESVYKAADYHCACHKSYAAIDSSYLSDLSAFVRRQVKENQVDVAFVDSGLIIRGDLVQTLFNKVPLIVAHDVAPLVRREQADVYGYGRVAVPDNYVEVYVAKGKGTAFWVKNDDDHQEVIRVLQEYAKATR